MGKIFLKPSVSLYDEDIKIYEQRLSTRALHGKLHLIVNTISKRAIPVFKHCSSNIFRHGVLTSEHDRVPTRAL